MSCISFVIIIFHNPMTPSRFLKYEASILYIYMDAEVLKKILCHIIMEAFICSLSIGLSKQPCASAVYASATVV